MDTFREKVLIMPIYDRNDEKGDYFQWGDRGKKYYYEANNEKSKKIARRKAWKQSRAIFSMLNKRR